MPRVDSEIAYFQGQADQAEHDVSGFGIDRLPRIVRGEGSYVYDASGKRYLDGSGGPAVFSLGHAHPEINAAINEQLSQFTHGYRYLFTTHALEELREVVKERCNGHFQDVIFCGSGSESVEGALKVALQYFAARGLMRKRHFIGRRRSWHGNTLGALSVSDFKERRKAFEGSLLDVSFVSSANAYRPPVGVSSSELTRYLADELDQTIEKLGPDTVAAFIFEPIVGAAGGVVPAPANYCRAVREVCRKHDVVMIADEVMCGAGRSGTWRTLEHEGVIPDIMCVAKGLAGGYIPLGATLMTAHIGKPILEQHGAYQTGHTFTGHTAACAAGVALQRVIIRDRLLERVCIRGAQLKAQIREALGGFDEVGDVRGRGYFIGVELVQDAVRKTPFPRQRGLSADVGARCFDDGLICYPCAGNVDGTNGDTIILAPPYNATDSELEELVAKLARGIGSALNAC
jgi:adenosylmethionine-8-amino-7-oxononanoate aminotransferase